MIGPLTPETLAVRCRFWQEALRLQDWDLALSIGRMHELGVGTLGDCEPSKVKRQARIRLLDPRDVEAHGFHFDGEAWCWETTLVHELLHLHFHDVFDRDWPDDSPRGVAAERAIHAISKALVAGEDR